MARGRLCRIEEGRWIAGVCQGISAYTGFGVDWIRALFLILMFFAMGIPLLVYAVLLLFLPAKKTYADYAASKDETG